MTAFPLLSRADRAIAQAIDLRAALADRVHSCERLVLRGERIGHTMLELRAARVAQQEFWTALRAHRSRDGRPPADGSGGAVAAVVDA
jgi:hypothetical protein